MISIVIGPVSDEGADGDGSEIQVPLSFVDTPLPCLGTSLSQDSESLK